MSILRIGLVLGLTLFLAQAEDEVIKCPGGECVKLHLCRDGEIVTDGAGVIDIRFNPDDPCEHYLLKCCKIPGEDDEEIVVPPSSGHIDSGSQTHGDLIGVDNGGHGGNANGGNGHDNVDPSRGTGETGPSQGTGGQVPPNNNGGVPNNHGDAVPPHGTGNNVPPNNGGAGGDVPPHGPDGGSIGGKIPGDNGVTANPLIPPHGQAGCGYRNADGVGFRITGDTDGESEYGEFPWMVAILKEEKALDQVINVYQCGGSLIHPQVVLTAAHCVQNKSPEQIKIRLGEWDTQTVNEIYDHQDRNVLDIVVHDEFYKGGLFNDVALLFLDRPAELIETVNTVCLPPQNYNFDMNRCFASGWGRDVFGKDGKYQVILKKIELPIMQFDQCQSALRTTRLGKRFVLNKSFICAGGEPGRDTCKGDGGSPLVCPIPGTQNRYYQAGIVAWGIGCGETGIPGVYVNVAGFRGWIDEHLTKRNIPHDYYIYV